MSASLVGSEMCIRDSWSLMARRCASASSRGLAAAAHSATGGRHGNLGRPPRVSRREPPPRRLGSQ
eukprot:14174269-Alexandrium_andersonii.AAC.1